MQVALVGAPQARARLRSRLDRSIEVVGEFGSIAAARASGLAVDAFLVAPGRDDFHNPVEEPLTARESQVLELLAEGLPNQDHRVASWHQRSDGQVSRCVDLGHARRHQSHRRRPPRRPPRARYALVLGPWFLVLGPCLVPGPFLVLSSWSGRPVRSSRSARPRNSRDLGPRTKDQGRTRNQARTRD